MYAVMEYPGFGFTGNIGVTRIALEGNSYSEIGSHFDSTSLPLQINRPSQGTNYYGMTLVLASKDGVVSASVVTSHSDGDKRWFNDSLGMTHYQSYPNATELWSYYQKNYDSIAKFTVDTADSNGKSFLIKNGTQILRCYSNSAVAYVIRWASTSDETSNKNSLLEIKYYSVSDRNAAASKTDLEHEFYELSNSVNDSIEDLTDEVTILSGKIGSITDDYANKFVSR